MSDDLVLTGATGFVGMEVLERYLERSDRRIIALVRAPDDAAAGERIAATLRGLFGARHRYAGRVQAIAADLTAPGLGLTSARRVAIARRAADIIHAAAAVSFSLPLAEARATNVAGTHRMLQLAEDATMLGAPVRYFHLSTAYVAGTHEGRFHEHDHQLGQSFHNPYEQSKFEAEELLRSTARLPVTILRPSIIVGDRRTGWTAAFNVLYWPLRAFARGLYPAVPAVPSSLVDAVSIDYVADAIHALCEADAGSGRTYHLTAGRNASNIAELTELAARYFKRPPPRVIPPAEFAEYLRTLPHRQGSALLQGAVYFPYFAIRTEFDDTHARARLEPAGITTTPLASYIERLLDFATRTRWGKRPLTRREALAA